MTQYKLDLYYENSIVKEETDSWWADNLGFFTFLGICLIVFGILVSFTIYYSGFSLFSFILLCGEMVVIFVLFIPLNRLVSFPSYTSGHDSSASTMITFVQFTRHKVNLKTIRNEIISFRYDGKFTMRCSSNKKYFILKIPDHRDEFCIQKELVDHILLRRKETGSTSAPVCK